MGNAFEIDFLVICKSLNDNLEIIHFSNKKKTTFLTYLTLEGKSVTS